MISKHTAVDAPDELAGMYRTMVRIREFELEAERLFVANQIPGFIHVSIGQEAVAAGVCAAMEATDYMTTTHRGHGHTIAKGASMRGMMAELFGKEHGICRGMGGSMHIADFSIGMLGANGIVAGGLGLAVGAALQSALHSDSRVAVAFFSDGATARGPFAEALNLAKIWKLPVVFVCENNGWASTTKAEEGLAQPRIIERSNSMNVHSIRVDGNDVVEVNRAAREAMGMARGGGGPALIEAVTFRLRGHYVGDPTTYYDHDELKSWVAKDPINVLRERLSGFEDLEADWFEQAAVEARCEVEDAIAYAREDAWPAGSDLAGALFSDPLTGDAPLAHLGSQGDRNA